MRIAACRALCSLLALLSAAVVAQSYPTRAVRVIVPYPAGGTVDAVARVVAQRLTEQMGQSFVVENRAGANGVIGSDAVAKAQPDGYTLLVQASTFVTNPILLRNLPYDMLRDFTPVSNFGSVPLVVTTYPSMPAANLKEFIALVTAAPDKYAFAAPPTGSAGHLAEEAIKSGAKLSIAIVPYKGTAPAMTDVMGGHASALIDALPSSWPQVKGGKLKALAVTSPKRIAFMPNVPTVAESGLAGFDMVSWYGLWAPANLPRELSHRLAAEVAKAVRSPLAVERLGDQGFDAVGSTPEEFAAFIGEEFVKYTRIIRQANIKVE